jgi:hypothetical protein
MPVVQRAHLIACSAVIAGCLAYMLCDFGGWPKLTYLPYEGEWRVAATPPSPSAMVYPGMLLWALLGAALGGGAAALISKKVQPGRGVQRLFGAWAALSFGLVALYFLWSLWPF